MTTSKPLSKSDAELLRDAADTIQGLLARDNLYLEVLAERNEAVALLSRSLMRPDESWWALRDEFLLRVEENHLVMDDGDEAA